MTPQELIARYNIRHLYHFTDAANVASIRANGGLLSLDQMERRGIIACRPGGNQWSHDADRCRGLHRYVHLSFTGDHPMCYVAENDGRIGPTQTLRISASVLHGAGLLFTTDIANKSGVQLLDWDQAVSAIDFEVLYTYNIIPIDRTRLVSGDPLLPCYAALARGDILIFFPEGSRQEPEQLGVFKPGLARLVERCPTAHVVPVFMHGLGKAWPKGSALIVPFIIDVFVGHPLHWRDDRGEFMARFAGRIEALGAQGSFPGWA